MRNRLIRTRGQVTLMHLLFGIVLMMPPAAVVTVATAKGAGVRTYLFGLPVALLVGVAIVVFDWKIVKLFWVRSQRYSERFQTVLAVVVFLMQIFWIGAAGESGFALATFVVRHVG